MFDAVRSNPPTYSISYKDMVIDSGYGPYPVNAYVHGTGSFRTASHALITHWAGCRFVVICGDNPGIMIGDLMEGSCGALLKPAEVAQALNSFYTAN